MLEPKVANFARVKRDIDDYDDLNDLRETNIGQRLAQLREKIYKNNIKKTADSPGMTRAKTQGGRKVPPKIGV